jgi:hypothetical protein
MDLIYGAEVTPFRFAFVLTRRQSLLAQSGAGEMTPSIFKPAENHLGIQAITHSRNFCPSLSVRRGLVDIPR